MPTPSTLAELLYLAPPDRTAIVLPDAGIEISYAKLREQIMTMADALAALGIRPGDRVATVLPNGLPAIVSFLASSIAGTAAPLNPGYRHDEFSFFLEDTSAKILLCPPDGAPDARKAAEGKVPVYSLEMDATGFVRIAGAGNGTKSPAPSADGLALVLHTSGSTGRPKRVPIRHRNIAASAKNIVDHYSLSPNDVALCAMPLFHVHGLVASTIATLASGGTIVVPSKFNPLSFWRTVRDNRVTWYSAVPTIHSLLLSRAGDERPAGCEGLRFIRSCSAALPPEMMAKMEAVFGAPVLEAYGMTEASHQMCSNPQPPAARKPGSVGPGTGVKVSIMDGKGNHLNSGERGEVVIQGPNVVDGYENNPEANAASFTNGWFRTGDQGILDAERICDAHRPPQGADQPRRRKSRSARNRRSVAEPSLSGRSRRLRRPSPHLGRRSGRGGGVARAAARSRHSRLLQGTPGRLQASEKTVHCRNHPPHRHRKNSTRRRRQGAGGSGMTQCAF